MCDDSWIELRDVVWMLRARSVSADCGSYIPRPPFFRSICDIRQENCRRLGKLSSAAI